MPSLSNGQTSGTNESWCPSFLLVYARLPLEELATPMLVVVFLSHSPPHPKLREMWDFGLRWPPINWNNRQSTDSGIFGERDIGEEAHWSGSVWGCAVPPFGLLNGAGGGTKKLHRGLWQKPINSSTHNNQPTTGSHNKGEDGEEVWWAGGAREARYHHFLRGQSQWEEKIFQK